MKNDNPSWSSVDELAREFSLEHVASDLSTLESELKALRAESHPDKNGGAFSHEAQKERFIRLGTAIHYVQEIRSGMSGIIRISQLPAIIHALSGAVNRVPIEASRDIFNAMSQQVRPSVARRYRPFKIGSGIVAGVSAFLFYQARTIKDHPLLGALGIKNTVFLTSGLLLLSLISLSITWIRERKEGGLVRYLMSEHGLHDACRMLQFDVKDGRVSSHDLRERFRGDTSYPYLLYKHPILRRLCGWVFDLWSCSPEDDVIDKIVELQTRRLIERKVLKPVDTPAVVQWYEVHADSLKTL